MNVRTLLRASQGKLNPNNPPAHAAHGPLSVTIDHAGALFGFQHAACAAGAIEVSPASSAGAVRAVGGLGSLLLIGLGVWLFYRGITSSKKWNLQTVAGFFMIGNGLGRLAEWSNPEQTAVTWATIAGGQYTKNS